MIRRLALLLLLVPATPGSASPVEIHYVMGTYLRVVTEDAAARPAVRACFREARRLDRVFSRFDATSELSSVNASAGIPIVVSADFAALLGRAQALATVTNGAFDVTVGPLTALWRGDASPASGAVAAARAGVGREQVRLQGTRLVLDERARLDFDGIAKGYAVDRCADLLRAAGVRRALVSFGESSIYALGAPAGEDAWALVVRGPGPEEAVGLLRLRDRAASISATFGDRGRGGGGRAHIIDPATGRPIRDEAVGVIVASSATDAEAYSKALLVWGAGAVARVERIGATAAVHVHGGEVRRGSGASVGDTFTSLAGLSPLVAAEALR